MIDWAAWQRRSSAVVDWSARHPIMSIVILLAFVVWGEPAIVPFLH